MDKKLNKIDETIKFEELELTDIEELEEIVTPGSGFGCNCNCTS